MKFFSDLFKGVGGQSWELARITAAWAVVSYSGAFLYALAWKGSVPDWASLGVGYAAVLAGAGAFVGIKDVARAKATATDATTAQQVQETEQAR